MAETFAEGCRQVAKAMLLVLGQCAFTRTELISVEEQDCLPAGYVGISRL